MPLGVIPDGLVQRGAELRWYGPVLPGAQELSWSWVLTSASPAPAEGPERFDFALSVPARTERLVLIVADPDAVLEATGLSAVLEARASRDRSRQVDGRSVRRWTLEAPPAGALALRLRCHPPASRGRVSLSEVRAVVQLDDAALDVTETHTLRIDGDTHVLRTAETPLLRISLPEGAAQLRFGSDAPGLELASHPDGGLAAIGSVAPGEVRIELGYQLALGEPPARLVRTLATRTPLLSIFVADNGRLAPRSERLHRPAHCHQRPHLSPLEAFEVDAGERWSSSWARCHRAHAVGKLALGLCCRAAAAAWLLTRPLREGPKAEANRSQAVADSSRRVASARRSHEAIHDLDHDHETASRRRGPRSPARRPARARAALLARSVPRTERLRAGQQALPPGAQRAERA